ncbi:bifunctional phosphoglucose/phosphomannose isomerase [bacterium]|nr:bifunctional phosphoglucose/phosphomannose isomerase [bacterium]
MDVLDDMESMKEMDISGMFDLVLNLDSQCEKAVSAARSCILRDEYSEVEKIIVIGMGGSAIGGDILSKLLINEIKVPIFVNRNYHLPNFADKKTLVFATSYSGNTEETLSSYNDAKERGCKIICVTSGGKLAENAESDNIPLIIIPGGQSPRSALGYMFFPVLIAMQNLGLTTKTEDINETIAMLKRFKTIWGNKSADSNLAKKLAKILYNKFPLIYSIDGCLGPVALRWKTQLNENSKILAYNNIFPELDHNEIVGWEGLDNLTKDMSVIILRDKDDSERNSKRIAITSSIIEDKPSEITEVWTQGNSILARMFSLIYLGDFVSFYLAMLYKVDPTPVDRIETLKKKLLE